MNKKHLFVLIISLTVLLSGCAKFLKTESENLTPFANHTISLVSSLEYGLSDNKILHLRGIKQYIDNDAPFARYLALENQISNQLKALVAYSIEMVTISELPISGNEKSNALADILISLSDIAYKNEVISVDRKEERNRQIIANVRANEEYIGSLRLLLPMINNFSAHALKAIDELEREKRKLVLILEDAVDKKYGDAIAFDNELRKIRNKFYNALIAISDYAESQDVKDLDEARSYGILALNKILKGKKSLDADDLIKVHTLMTKRMSMINENHEQLQPDIDAYYDNHRELKRVVEIKEVGIKEARLTFIVWSRAYQKMALGKTNPAEWFDVSESGTLLMGAAGRAVGL